MPLLTLTIAWLGALTSAPSPASGGVVRLPSFPYEYPAPQLAVGARGDGVAAWTAPSELRGGNGEPMVFASLRPAGRGLGRVRAISDPAVGVAAFGVAMGAAGDGAIVWQPDTVGSGRLRVSRRRAGGAFGAPVVVPGSAGAISPVASIDAGGNLLLAWMRSGRDRCGSLVMASVAPRGRRLARRPRRVSERCAHATHVRAALARDGDGAVVWRTEGASAVASNSAVRASAYSGGRFQRPRTVSTASRIGATLAVAAGGRRALVVWRDAGPARHGRIRGRVLTAAISGARVGPPVAALATHDRLLGPVAVAMNVHDAAIVSWLQTRKLVEEPDISGHVALMAASRQPFGRSARIALYVEYAPIGVGLDAAGRALVGYNGDYVRRRSPGGGWRGAARLQPRDPNEDEDNPLEPTQASVGVADSGEAVAMWLLSSDDGDGLSATVLAPPRR